ncbi:ferrous iron transport protein A [uncultured Bifidobacterium sp.]|uniref:ferrous iron transport protein A n=1 Tax=uncultured Bifidobacterium sp. TaxID=165187 RepID=UPI00258DA0F9|nr:ferrous iron transport protein A [uncultured Bifidobacterium sp.]
MKREPGTHSPHPHDPAAASHAGKPAHRTGFDSDGEPGGGNGSQPGNGTGSGIGFDAAREWTLEDCPVGQDMRVTGVRMDERHVLRMLELGIRAGGLVRVTQRSNFGGRVIAIGTGRIAVDAATAQSITVRSAEPNTHGEQS